MKYPFYFRSFLKYSTIMVFNGFMTEVEGFVLFNDCKSYNDAIFLVIITLLIFYLHYLEFKRKNVFE